jgi:hypothetical protein
MEQPRKHGFEASFAIAEFATSGAKQPMASSNLSGDKKSNRATEKVGLYGALVYLFTSKTICAKQPASRLWKQGARKSE